MPYLTKSELKHVILSAFNEGIIAGVSIDQHDNTPEEMFNALDVNKFYKESFIIQSKHNKRNIKETK